MFDDIKVGDLVLIRVAARPDSAFGSGNVFTVGKKVERVTPKRFQVGSAIYSKETGRQIGAGYGWAAAYNAENDQSEDLDAENQRVNLTYGVRRVLDEIEKQKIKGVSFEKLLKCHSLAKELLETLKEE